MPDPHRSTLPWGGTFDGSTHRCRLDRNGHGCGEQAPNTELFGQGRQQLEVRCGQGWQQLEVRCGQGRQQQEVRCGQGRQQPEVRCGQGWQQLE